MLSKTNSHITNVHKVRVGYISAFLLLVTSLGLAHYTTKKLIDQTNNVANTNAIINNLEQCISYVKDAETGVRGYFIMKDSAFLEPYLHSKKKVDSLYTIITHQVANHSHQSGELKEIHKRISQRYYVLKNAIDTFVKYNYQTSIFSKKKSITGKMVMDSLRMQIKAMQDKEKLELTQRQQQVERITAYINYVNIGSLIVSMLLTFFAISTFNRENKARNEAARQANRYRGRLEERIKELRNANIELVALRSNEKFASTGRIARTIAHEVRNPLTNINLALEQLQDETSDIPGADVLISMINRNSLRIQQLITDLLNSTKFTELNFNTVSVNDLLDEALLLAQDRIILNKVEITKNYSDGICDVFVDIDKLKIAFLNIIVNAIEAMQPGAGILNLATSKQNGTCYILIKDNGAGMNEETLQKLFDPYFTRKSNGNGLGMTNTQNIILNHKGVIHAESEEGKGTIITIRLPFPEQAN